MKKYSVEQCVEMLDSGIDLYVKYYSSNTWHNVSSYFGGTQGNTDCNSRWDWSKYSQVTPDITTIPEGSKFCKKCFTDKFLENQGVKNYNLV